MSTLVSTNFKFNNLKSFYKGKVRDVYNINDEKLVIVATDRISAFDVVLPKGIPCKGQILNTIATKFMNETKDIVPNWIECVPHPNVAIGKVCEPIKIEMVIRGYLTGHAWREYNKGKRVLCGVDLPEGMIENDKFPSPIITPATKADLGEHDEDISKEEILKRNIISEEDYSIIEKYTYDLFNRGTKIAEEKGLILVDTKYEFGKTKNGEILLIDEIHTPDSSRYFYKKGYTDRQNKGIQQKQLSKEFVRQWLIENNFQGKENEKLPEMTNSFVESVKLRYKELYEILLDENFNFEENSEETIYNAIIENI